MTCSDYDNESLLCIELLGRHRFIRNKQNPATQGCSVLGFLQIKWEDIQEDICQGTLKM